MYGDNMNINERISSETEKTLKLMETISNNIRVASPAIIEEFDPITATVSCKIAIKENLVDKKTNEVTPTEISLLVDVPIIIPNGGNYAITLPIKKGDECLVVFGDKCINSWWANGGVQNQEETRSHDLSDGFAILGVKSLPNIISNYSSENLEIRNLEGTKKITFSESDIQIINESNTKIDIKPNEILIQKGDKTIHLHNHIDIIDGSSKIEVKNNKITLNSNSVEINGTLKINGTDYLQHKHQLINSTTETGEVL